MLDAPLVGGPMLEGGVANPDIAAEALAGLTATPKTLPSKLFYDAEGVRLFDAITRLPEYYLTRTETKLLRRISPELVRLPPAGSALIEYGASDETKARLLLDAAGAQFAAYVPVDVAAEALDHIQIRLQRHAPTLAVHPLCADFTQDPVLPQAVGRMAKFGFFPGSTIGNLDPPAARRFLVDTRRTLGDGAWLVVGADLRKDEETLHAAYNDAAGVTAAFNLNMLKHLNRETGADFDLRRFAHVAIWNATESRIEMHLRSQTDQTVTVAGTRVDFRAGETIHTENSYKHSLAAFQALASHAGWHPAQVWTDPDSLFSVHALHAVAE